MDQATSACDTGNPMIKVDKVVNRTNTDLHVSYEEPNILIRRPGKSGVTTMPWEIPTNTTGGTMMNRRLEQRQIQEKALVAVLLIEDSHVLH